MFRWTSRVLMYKEILDCASQNLINALIESFAAHTRVLIYFFYDTPKQDDVLAEHFIKNWGSGSVRPEKTEVLKEAKTKADKQLAHLTYARVREYRDKNRKAWRIVEISRDMESILQKFLEELPQEFRLLFENYGVSIRSQ